MHLPRRMILVPVLAATSLLAIACDGENLPDLGLGSTTTPSGPEGTAVPPATDPPATEAPPATDPPATDPPATDPPATDPPATDPPATQAPVAPAPTEPPGEVDGDGDDDGEGLPGWLVPVLVAAVLAVVVAIVVSSRRRRDPSGAADPRRQLVATARWIHDQLSLELLALPPADAQQRWANDRVRFDQLSIDARTAAMTSEPELWNQLASIVDTLASSIDTAVRVRAADGADVELARESVAIANRHRSELDAWIVNAQQLL